MLREVRAELTRIDFEKEQLELQLKAMIGMSRGTDGLATWKAQEHTDLDRRRLKMELPDIYESYSMVSIRRYFRLVG